MQERQLSFCSQVVLKPTDMYSCPRHYVEITAAVDIVWCRFPMACNTIKEDRKHHFVKDLSVIQNLKFFAEKIVAHISAVAEPKLPGKQP